MNISELVIRAHEDALDAGWHDDERSPAEFIALMHSELSECLEGFRDRNWAVVPDKHCPRHLNVTVELADCVIRIADFCGVMGFDLEGAIEAKMEANRARGYRHGGKAI